MCDLISHSLPAVTLFNVYIAAFPSLRDCHDERWHAPPCQVSQRQTGGRQRIFICWGRNSSRGIHRKVCKFVLLCVPVSSSHECWAVLGGLHGHLGSCEGDWGGAVSVSLATEAPWAPYFRAQPRLRRCHRSRWYASYTWLQSESQMIKIWAIIGTDCKNAL